jgi:hypothetical protein
MDNFDLNLGYVREHGYNGGFNMSGQFNSISDSWRATLGWLYLHIVLVVASICIHQHFVSYLILETWLRL